MGNLCQSKIITKEEIYYYKAVEQNITAETTEAKQKVKLTISLLNVQDSSRGLPYSLLWPRSPGCRH